MDALYDCLFLKHGLAFGLGTLIFLLTIILVARRVIGFTLSLIFLLIALGIALGIEYQDVVKSYINQYLPGTFKVEERPSTSVQPASRAPSTVPAQPTRPGQPSPTSTDTERSEEKPPLRGQVERQRSRVDQFFQDDK